MQARTIATARWGLAGSGAADPHDVALMLQEVAACEITGERLVDRRVGEVELVDLLGQRHPRDGQLVLDRTCLLLADLGGEQIANDSLGFVLTLDRRGEDLVMGSLHAEELELAHRFQDFGSFHSRVS
jgi:hypothetical protein